MHGIEGAPEQGDTRMGFHGRTNLALEAGDRQVGPRYPNSGPVPLSTLGRAAGPRLPPDRISNQVPIPRNLSHLDVTGHWTSEAAAPILSQHGIVGPPPDRPATPSLKSTPQGVPIDRPPRTP